MEFEPFDKLWVESEAVTSEDEETDCECREAKNEPAGRELHEGLFFLGFKAQK